MTGPQRMASSCLRCAECWKALHVALAALNSNLLPSPCRSIRAANSLPTASVLAPDTSNVSLQTLQTCSRLPSSRMLRHTLHVLAQELLITQQGNPFGLTDPITAHAAPLLPVQVSSVNSQNVQALFTSLFARMLATIPGIPQELASLAVQQAKEVRDS